MAISFRKIHWTEHSKIKMKQYGLSKQKVLGIIYRPERVENGIASGTTAVMRTNPPSHKVPAWRGKKELQSVFTKNSSWQKKLPGEIWIMYKDAKDFRNIISAWRYPGVTKPGQEIPVPEDIKKFLESGIID